MLQRTHSMLCYEDIEQTSVEWLWFPYLPFGKLTIIQGNLKGLFALAFQGFLIMVCVGIYAVLINGMIIADNIHSALFSVAAYTVILCFSLFKTGSLAKSIFHAH